MRPQGLPSLFRSSSASPTTTEWQENLQPTAATPARVRAILDLGIDIEELADAVGVTQKTVRNWLAGSATPRRDPVRVIDDLRQVILHLGTGGIEGAEAAQWLRSRQGGALEDQRPLDLIDEDPLPVLAAASAAGVTDQLRDDGLRSVPDPTPTA
jgi:hypothetical protein